MYLLWVNYKGYDFRNHGGFNFAIFLAFTAPIYLVTGLFFFIRFLYKNHKKIFGGLFLLLLLLILAFIKVRVFDSKKLFNQGLGDSVL